MEEVYVIRLRGVPSNSTSSSSSSAVDIHDVVRGASLGLGVLHAIFGLLVVIFGALRTTSVEHEPAETMFGTLFGPVFVATGIAAVLCWRRPFRKLKMKVFFGFSVLSLAGSTAFLGLCFLGLASYHGVPRLPGDAAHVTANAVLACFGEWLVSAASVATAGGAAWKTWRCGKTAVIRPSIRQKVIVKTDIVGGAPAEGGGTGLDDGVVRRVSPHCVISLRANDDEQRAAIRKVEQYLHAQDELSFTFSDPPSSLHEEQDLGVDSQNWRNEVLALAMEEDKGTIDGKTEETTEPNDQLEANSC